MSADDRELSNSLRRPKAEVSVKTPQTKPIEKCRKLLAKIEAELEYINSLNRMTGDNGVSGQLVTLTHLIGEANKQWVNNPGNQEALDIVRKIAATSLRTLMLYGCPER